MSSKLYSRSGALVWSPTGIENKGLIVTDFAQCFDPTASSLSSRIDFLSTSDIFSKSQLAPTVSVETSYKFNELAWSNLKSENHPSGLVAGGTEDGSVVFFDAEILIQNAKLEIISAEKDHHGHVMTIAASNDGRWMCSGGGSGQLLLWDMTNLASPFTPGVPNFQDQVKQLRWNAKTESIFASISSFRVSCWDMRRHGSPVLEFAEIGQGCDWSSLCWCPSDSSQLIVGSQSNHNSVIQKWDLRFTSTPLKEYRHHNAGTTSIDWNKSDNRLMVSSGCDGQIAIWNQENGEILGGAGSLQGDWIRKVEWNKVDPSQFAVQYFQHPVQILSISSLGVPQEGAEVLATRITDNFIPAWCSAPIIGASVALGGRLVTHWKSYDAISQKYVHNVEVETIANLPSLAADVQEFAQALKTKKALAWYIHDHAFKRDITSEDDDLLRLTWLLLVDQLDGRSRKKIMMHLGFLEKAETSIEPISTAPTTHQSYRTRSDFTSTGRSSYTDQHDTSSWEEEDVFVSSNIDWSRLDEKCWNLMEYHIKNDHQKAIEVLCSSQKWMAAVQCAIRHDSDMVKIVFEEYNKVHPETDGKTELVKSLCSKYTSSHTDASSKWDSCIESFPDHKWRTLLGMLISTEQSIEELALAANKIGNKWMNEGKMLRACVAFAIGLKSVMVASIKDRVKQGFALAKSNSSTSVIFEKCIQPAHDVSDAIPNATGPFVEKRNKTKTRRSAERMYDKPYSLKYKTTIALLSLLSLFGCEGKSELEFCAISKEEPLLPLSNMELPKTYTIRGSITDFKSLMTYKFSESSDGYFRIVDQYNGNWKKKWLQNMNHYDMELVSMENHILNTTSFESVIGNDRSSVGSILNGLSRFLQLHVGFEIPGYIEAGLISKRWVNCSKANEKDIVVILSFSPVDGVPPATYEFANPLIISLHLIIFEDSVVLEDWLISIDSYQMPLENDLSMAHGSIESNLRRTNLPMDERKEFAAVMIFSDHLKNLSEKTTIFFSSEKNVFVVTGKSLENRASVLNSAAWIYDEGTSSILHDFNYGYELTMKNGVCGSFTKLPATNDAVEDENGRFSLKSVRSILVDESLIYFQYPSEFELDRESRTTYRAYDPKKDWIVEVIFSNQGELRSINNYESDSRRLINTLEIRPLTLKTWSYAEFLSQFVGCYNGASSSTFTYRFDVFNKKMIDLAAVNIFDSKYSIAYSFSRVMNNSVPYRYKLDWCSSENSSLTMILSIIEKSEVEPSIVGYDYKAEITSQEAVDKLLNKVSSQNLEFNVFNANGQLEIWALKSQSMRKFPVEEHSSEGFSGFVVLLVATVVLSIGVLIGVSGLILAIRYEKIYNYLYL